MITFDFIVLSILITIIYKYEETKTNSHLTKSVISVKGLESENFVGK